MSEKISANQLEQTPKNSVLSFEDLRNLEFQGTAANEQNAESDAEQSEKEKSQTERIKYLDSIYECYDDVALLNESKISTEDLKSYHAIQELYDHKEDAFTLVRLHQRGISPQQLEAYYELEKKDTLSDMPHEISSFLKLHELGITPKIVEQYVAKVNSISFSDLLHIVRTGVTPEKLDEFIAILPKDSSFDPIKICRIGIEPRIAAKYIESGVTDMVALEMFWRHKIHHDIVRKNLSKGYTPSEIVSLQNTPKANPVNRRLEEIYRLWHLKQNRELFDFYKQQQLKTHEFLYESSSILSEIEPEELPAVYQKLVSTGISASDFEKIRLSSASIPDSAETGAPLEEIQKALNLIHSEKYPTKFLIDCSSHVDWPDYVANCGYLSIDAYEQRRELLSIRTGFNKDIVAEMMRDSISQEDIEAYRKHIKATEVNEEDVIRLMRAGKNPKTTNRALRCGNTVDDYIQINDPFFDYDGMAAVERYLGEEIPEPLANTLSSRPEYIEKFIDFKDCIDEESYFIIWHLVTNGISRQRMDEFLSGSGLSISVFTSEEALTAIKEQKNAIEIINIQEYCEEHNVPISHANTVNILKCKSPYRELIDLTQTYPKYIPFETRLKMADQALPEEEVEAIYDGAFHGLAAPYLAHHSLDKQKIANIKAADLSPIMKRLEEYKRKGTARTFSSEDGYYGPGDTLIEYATSRPTAKDINKLIRVESESPNSSFRALEQTRLDAIRIDGLIYPDHSFIHHQYPGKAEVIHKLIELCEAQEKKPKTETEIQAELAPLVTKYPKIFSLEDADSKIIAENIVARKYNQTPHSIEVANDQTLTDLVAKKEGETALALLKRIGENDTIMPTQKPKIETTLSTTNTNPELYEQLNALINDPTSREDTSSAPAIEPLIRENGEILIDLKDISQAVKKVNEIIAMETANNKVGVESSLIQAITYLGNLGLHAIRKLPLEKRCELAFDEENFKPLVEMSFRTASAQNFDSHQFELFWNSVKNRMSEAYNTADPEQGHFEPDTDIARDALHIIANHVNENCASLNYIANPETTRWSGAVYSGNLEHALSFLAEEVI